MSSRITRSQLQNQPNQFQIDSRSIDECGVFNIVEVEHDGDCLFSSILGFIEQNRHHFERAPQTANALRLEAVNYILSRNSIGFQQNWERFFGKIEFNLNKRIDNLSKYGQNEQQNETIKQSYRRYMVKSGNFGTFSELIALAELYGFIVHIFQRDESHNYVCYEAGTTGKQIIDRKKLRLYMLFTGPTDSGHFRRLSPSIAPTTIQHGYYRSTDDRLTQHQQGIRITVKKRQTDR